MIFITHKNALSPLLIQRGLCRYDFIAISQSLFYIALMHTIYSKISNDTI
ncbi:hypothetical protein PROPEN_04328 [Proteus penneri ATCC 35198]|nr:hypothetical protein PROPEN_04328 [Proteus penneri ATCC 35198]